MTARLARSVFTAVILTVLGAAETTSALADDPPPQGERWAVLIGVDDYAHLNPLNYCGGDMLALRERLIRSGFDADRVVLLHDKAEKAKYRPSKANIETEIALILDSAEREDVVLVAFGGHGVYRNGTGYLCPYDANTDDPATLISLAKLYADFQRCPARFKLAIVDACRNNPVRGEGRTAEARDRALKFAQSIERAPDGIVVLNSCSAGQEAKADDDLKHGVFTHFLLKGWEGDADTDRDGVVTLGELFTYTGRQTADYVRLNYSAIQKPKLLGELSPEVLQFGLARLDVLPPAVPLAGEPGETITNSIGMKLALIPTGEFMMGSPDGEEGRNKDEGPQHRVRITRQFFMGVYEVTKAQFAKFVDATEHDAGSGFGYSAQKKVVEESSQYTWRSWGVNQSDESPVVNVNWEDAQAFCRWLSRQEGKTYRLPTEAEWEYACRAGTVGRFSSGDNEVDLLRVANVGDASVVAYLPVVTWAIQSNDGWPFTAPMGKFAPNSWGLYDMHGNVHEWCGDWYGENYYANSPEDAPPGPSTGSFRIARGGGFVSSVADLRCARRFVDAPSRRSCGVGFRVVCEP
jgi:formylglycine-generating enzyme required for sulfatase activity